jgi:hypothetical protein
MPPAKWDIFEMAGLGRFVVFHSRITPQSHYPELVSLSEKANPLAHEQPV